MRPLIWSIFLSALLLASCPVAVAQAVHNIIVDQFGYRPGSEKHVVFSDPQVGQYSELPAFSPGSTFEVRRASDDEVVFVGSVSQWGGGVTDSASGDRVWDGDFSALTTPGSYYVAVPAGTNPGSRSYDFDIGDRVYNPVLRAAQRAFYYWRCGTDLLPEHAGNWSHPACHLGPGQDLAAELHIGTPMGQPRDVHGGWHDAGDYGKYVEWTFTVLWELMHAVEWFPDGFTDHTNIPESGNGVPDMLDEAKHELDWLLRMQFPDGSLAGKVQPIVYESGSPPDLSPSARYYTGVSTGATAAGAGAFALGARMFGPYGEQYPGYAAALRDAAELAWGFLLAHPEQIVYDNTGFAGASSNSSLAQERQLRLAAAAELFALTGDSGYRGHFDAHYDDPETTVNGHQPIISNLFDANGSAVTIEEAMVTYCLTPGATPGVVSAIKTSLRNGIEWNLMANIGTDPYRAYVVGYWWGSNRTKAQYGNMLLWGARLDVDPARSAAYQELAEDYLHYLHGRNPLGIVYLTNMGAKGANAGAERSAMNIWSIWFRDGSPLYDDETSLYGPAPGYLSGGPNAYYSGDVTPPRGEPPMKAFVDWNGEWPENSWEITEPAIYYNASYVFLVSAFAGQPGEQPSQVSYAMFEEGRYPWAAFSVGPGQAATRREALVGSAHSGAHLVSADVTGQGATGLRLDLPATPTASAEASVRVWVRLRERSPSDSSCFFGMTLSDAESPSGSWLSDALGWEVVSETASTCHLAGTEVALPVGLAADGWHLVQVSYVAEADSVQVHLDGVLVADEAGTGAAGRAPRCAVIAALGGTETARQSIYVDDACFRAAGLTQAYHIFGSISGPGGVGADSDFGSVIRFGNGCPVLGCASAKQYLPADLFVGLGLPAGYSLLSAIPEATRTGDGIAVWQLPVPDVGQEGLVHLRLRTPAEPSGASLRLPLWVTDDPAAAAVDPPSPVDWASPCGPVWGCPQDVCAQEVEATPHPDVWVLKEGSPEVLPGQSANYVAAVGNRGSAPAAEITLRDHLPSLLGGGDRIIANLAQLDRDEVWRGVVRAVLSTGAGAGEVLLNEAYTPTVPGEVEGGNNSSVWEATVAPSQPPNWLSVSPPGGVDPNDVIEYQLQCTNRAVIAAYGVYAVMGFDRDLVGATLTVSDPTALAYDPVSRALVWELGAVAPGAGGSASFSLAVASDARRARPIVGQATIYFPSVPQETPTNMVVNVVNGSFPDVPWDHWAVGEIESTHEAGIVQGYPNGEYRPAIVVTRDQMAVFVARAMAGGDENVPTGPETASFPDVDTEHWAYKYIEYAVDREVVEGYPNGTYRPANPVDRGQMAVYMARALAGGEGNVPPAMPPATFPDVGPGTTWEWCWPHVEYIATHGIAGGYEDGTYRPQYTCTRDQMAVYVTRGFRLPM